MQLDNLTHWRLQGTPDVFTERWNDQEWLVVHTGGATHWAGFYKRVEFDRSIKWASATVEAALYTDGGLMIRLGIDPEGGIEPRSDSIVWGGWEGPDNGWLGHSPKRIGRRVEDLNTKCVTVFLESVARYPVRANTSRWRDVQLSVEYGGDPEPPDPEPEPEPGIPGQIAALQAEITELYEQVSIRLTKIDALIVQWNQAQVWIDDYNSNLEV